MKIVKVILPIDTDKTFDYYVPYGFEFEIFRGDIVQVDFKNKKYFGLVYELSDSSEIKNLKPVEKKIYELVISEKMFTFMNWISQYYFVSKGLVVKNFLPYQISYPRRYVCISKEQRYTELYYETLKRALPKSDIEKLTKRKFEDLLRENIVKEELFPYVEENYFPKSLTDEQENAFLNLKNSFDKKNFETFLLFGQPATGKSEVYIKFLKYVFENSRKQILVLLPEIGLVEQTYKIFSKLFGSIQIAKIHSELSKGEFNFLFEKIQSFEKRIIIGTRSAIFLPYKDIGAIVVDEEQDISFKQYDMAPFYNARDCAVYLGKIFSSPVLLVSATPSCETYNNVLNKKYKLLKLENRFLGTEKPEVNIVYNEYDGRRISQSALDTISNSLDDGEQVIVFLNRRGYLNLYKCSDCGEYFKCDNCSVSYSFHKSKNRFICHYCLDEKPLDSKCKKCGGKLVPAGVWGTEMVETIFKKIYKDKKIERFDIDSTSRKGERNRIIENFMNRNIDILVGTQMVSKGYDVPNVSTVLILNFDSTINLPDIRSFERFMQLLVQTSGRAGRREKRGKIVIETSIRNEQIFEIIKDLNYQKFLEIEIQKRKEKNFPPFRRIMKISHKNKNREKAWININRIHDLLTKNNSFKDVKIFPPGFNFIEKVKSYYRTELFIFYKKYDNIKKLCDKLENLDFEFYIDNDSL
ncbi:TPA: primosomal protein N' [candidate division WOR-3]|uniref:Replication restart protein PriA n=3 Tax=Bacteria candidate phyla TaxID=1783234 RepID=A0A348MJR5_UNCW3|nr:primosomal protein N' [candidate division WOR-3 bacterium]HCP16475.1 primosomal protein N' [candidate division WOR-3 bacterium]